MLKEEVLSALVTALKNNNYFLKSSAKIYIFGSLLWKKNAVSDVDIAVVSKSIFAQSSIKSVLHNLSFSFPLDVVYMSEIEERELDFLANQKAIMLLSVT